MLKRILFITSLTILLIAPASAEDLTFGPICRGALPFTPSLGRFADRAATPVQQKEAEAREERERVAACERMKAREGVPFSFYGHRHAEAHCNKWVQQLQWSTGSTCCSDAYRGECRITSYDPSTKKTLIDGVWCAVGGNTKWGTTSVDPGLVLTCAPRVSYDADGRPICPTVYCVGRGLGS